MERFTGPQIGRLVSILQDDFNPNSFDQLLQARLDRVRYTITMAADFTTQIYDVVNRANQEWWHLQLLHAAVAARRQDVRLLEFAAQFLMPEIQIGTEPSPAQITTRVCRPTV